MFYVDSTSIFPGRLISTTYIIYDCTFNYICIVDKVEFQFVLKQNAVGGTIEVLIWTVRFATFKQLISIITFDISKISKELSVDVSLQVESCRLIWDIRLLHLWAAIW